MADTSPNLMTSAGGAYDRGCFRRGGTCACGGGVCGKEYCATPPSPSTAPEVDERAAFEAWVTRLAPGHLLARDLNGRYSADCNEWAWDGWKARAGLASRPAEVDDEGLPGLPDPAGTIPMYADDTEGNQTHEVDGYTAEQYRQGQRDAVAADRARRK